MSIGEGVPPSVPPVTPPIEGGNAGELLLKLIQLLTPLAGGTSSPGTSLKIPIEGKIYIPQQPRPEAFTRHPIRLLPPLQVIHKQMQQLVVAMGEGKANEGKKPDVSSVVPQSGSAVRAPIAPPKSEGKQSFDMSSFSQFPKEQKIQSPLPLLAQKAPVDVKEVLRFLVATSKSAESSPENLQTLLQQAQPTIEKLTTALKPQSNTLNSTTLEKQPHLALQSKPISTPPIQEKTTQQVPLFLKQLILPNPSLPRAAPLPLETSLLAAASELGRRTTSSPKQTSENPIHVEPKVIATVPFQPSFTSLERRLKRRKRAEKSLSWNEEEPQEKEEEKER